MFALGGSTTDMRSEARSEMSSCCSASRGARQGLQGISWDASLVRLQGTFHQKEASGGDPGHAGRSMSPRWPGST